MTGPIPGIFAIFIALAGAWYFFYTRSARRLLAIETPAANRLRITLRRANGIVLFLLSAAFYIGCYRVESDPPGKLFLIVWLIVCGLVGLSVIFVLMDLRLTAKTRRGSHLPKE